MHSESTDFVLSILQTPWSVQSAVISLFVRLNKKMDTDVMPVQPAAD